MLYVIGFIFLIITFVYLVYKSYQDNCLYPILILLFGPLVIWAYVLLILKTEWYKKLILLLLYYVSAGIVTYWIYVEVPTMVKHQPANEEYNYMEDFNESIQEQVESNIEREPEFYSDAE